MLPLAINVIISKKIFAQNFHFNRFQTILIFAFISSRISLGEMISNSSASSINFAHISLFGLTEMIFKVAKKRAFYVETKKLHHSQIILAEDDSLMIFQISVKPNKEMWAKFMELIEDLEIISPPEIREEMKSKINKIWERISK